MLKAMPEGVNDKCDKNNQTSWVLAIILNFAPI